MYPTIFQAFDKAGYTCKSALPPFYGTIIINTLCKEYWTTPGCVTTDSLTFADFIDLFL